MLPEMKGTAGLDRPPVMVAYGCGVDSTAMLVLLLATQRRPDVVVFADTGGEKPETYRYLFYIDEWMAGQGFARWPNVWSRPPGYEGTGLPERQALKCVAVVKNDGKYVTLENNCVQLAMLPSLAYGFKSCSEKYKQRPQHKFAKGWAPAVAWWGLDRRGHRPAEGDPRRANRVFKLIGYNAEETHRTDAEEDDFYRYVYPLREKGISRGGAVRLLQLTGLQVPPKSACFFCPASKKHEIARLDLQWPGLMKRALEMEAGADLKTMKGLGRYFSWKEFLASEEKDEPGPAADHPTVHPNTFSMLQRCLCVAPAWEGRGADRDEEEVTQEAMDRGDQEYVP